APGTPSIDTAAVLLYTSGTTGMPKGCLIGNDYYFFAAERYHGAGGLMRVEHGAERLYNPLPLFYANSLTISNPAMILSRNAMIFPDRFHPASWWREIIDSGATMIHYLGVIPPVLLAAPPSPLEREHSVRFGVGAGIDPAQRDAFERRFGIRIVEVWGMSEVGIATAANVEPRPAGRSIGRPLPGLLMRAVDDDDQPVGPGQPGELVLRRDGPEPRSGLFQRYHRDEETTARCWRNGWFHTGDVVQLEADGTFTFLDRKKHMIRRSGQNIAAAEVEACLRGHDAVAQVAVVPVLDELREQEVLAVVVPRQPVDDPRAAAERLFEYAAPRLAYFKVPGWAIFVDTLPTTATQKLQKFTLFDGDADPRQRPGMIDLRPLKQALTKRRGELP
ncbi:MAG: AMP-binding protein, partial [Lautropia sp.]